MKTWLRMQPRKLTKWNKKPKERKNRKEKEKNDEAEKKKDREEKKKLFFPSRWNLEKNRRRRKNNRDDQTKKNKTMFRTWHIEIFHRQDTLLQQLCCSSLLCWTKRHARVDMCVCESWETWRQASETNCR